MHTLKLFLAIALFNAAKDSSLITNLDYCKWTKKLLRHKETY
jgi:hypothetical protein